MKRNFLTMLALATGLVCSALAQTGYVNIDEVYARSTVITDLRNSISAKYQTQDEEVRALYTSFEADVRQFEQNNATMSDEERAAKQQELQAKQQEFQQKANELNQAVGDEFGQIQEKVAPEVERLIAKVARDNNVKMVMNGQLRLLINQQPTTTNLVLFAEDDIDLTDKVIEAFDKEAKIN